MNEIRTARAAAALLPFLLIAGCGDEEVVEPDPSVPTTVAITPDAVELLSSGATTGLQAVVRDQYGKAMPNASVTWNGSDPAVFTLAADGLTATVTAVANGTGTATATSGQASGTASVTVVQTPARLDIVSGNDQEALQGTTLTEPLIVRVAEQTGGVIAGVVVTFAPVDERSGSVEPAEATTGEDGTASAVWTLGDARRQQVAVSAHELHTKFRARATADPPMPDYAIVGALEPSRPDPLDTETIEVAARITNLGGGRSAGPFTIAYTVDGMHTEAVRADPIEPDDTATVTITAGPFAAGLHHIEAVLDPDGEFEEWDETNNRAETFVTALRQQFIGLGDSLIVEAPSGSPLFFRVEVEEQTNKAFTVRLNGPNGDGDIFVDFDTRPTAAFGHRCYSYNFGTDEHCELYPVREGTYHIAVNPYFSFSGAVLRVAAEEPADSFDLDLTLVNEGTASQNDIIAKVADRYASMIGVGGSDESVNLPADQCAPGMPELSDYEVDDFGLWVVIGPLDGAGNAVAMSGTCIWRADTGFGWVGMPTVGAVVLDEADIARLESDGVLEAVVTREMASALGFNPAMWKRHGFLRSPSLPDSPDADAHMNAPLVVAAFDAAGGAGYAGARAPLENGAVEAISDQFWRQSVFGDEVMTAYVTGDSQPLSRITLEALYEVGLEIDVMMADPFTLPGAGGAARARPRGAKAYPSLDLAAYRGEAPVAMVLPANVVKKK